MITIDCPSCLLMDLKVTLLFVTLSVLYKSANTCFIPSPLLFMLLLYLQHLTVAYKIKLHMKASTNKQNECYMARCDEQRAHSSVSLMIKFEIKVLYIIVH